MFFDDVVVVEVKIRDFRVLVNIVFDWFDLVMYFELMIIKFNIKLWIKEFFYGVDVDLWFGILMVIIGGSGLGKIMFFNIVVERVFSLRMI